MTLAIIDELQSPEMNPQAAFAGASGEVKDIKNLVKDKLGGVKIEGLEEIKEKVLGELEQGSLKNGKGTDTNVLQPPLAVSELETEITNRLGTLGNINVEQLTTMIPANPGVSQLQETVQSSGINNVLEDLTSSITGDKNIGKLNVSSDVQTPFDEFQTFLANAGALPSRVLNALIKVFKDFIDKISKPDEWLGTLSSETLTNLFIEQIQDLENSLPSQAIAAIELEVKHQTKILEDYQTFLAKYDMKNSDRVQIAQHRSEIKRWTREIESSHQKIEQMVQKIDGFEIQAFQVSVANLPKDATQNAAPLFNNIFQSIKGFLQGLEKRITDVVKKLQDFINKLTALIKEAIQKIEDITTGIVNKISETITKANGALDKIETYLKDAIEKLEKFINEACGKSGDIVAPLKKTCNSISGSAITTIDKVAGTIEVQTKNLEGSLKDFQSFMDTKLNREKLEKDIKEFLDKIMSFLNSDSVKNAIQAADTGISTAVKALENVSLKPAFQSAVKKSEDLEKKFKAMDVSKMGTAQKVALKVGVTVIKQVDVPKIVNPELKNAFTSVVDPLAGLVTSIQGETEKINEKIQSFKPGTLVNQWLSPYINSLTDELQKYKPSVILKDVKQLYLDLVDKLDVLDPNQLVALLDELYKKLEDLVASLNPASLVKFLDDKKASFVTMLEEFKTKGIPELEKKVQDAIGDAEKLLGGLGLDSVLKADFWKTLEDILSLNIDQKIKAVEQIKQKIIDKINNIQDEKVEAKLIALQTAIATYSNNPTDAIATAQTSLKESLTIYQEKYTTCQSQWQETQPTFEKEANRLKYLSQPVNYEYHFVNLKETCQVLSDALHTGISLKESSAPSPTTAIATTPTGDELAQELLKAIESRRQKLKVTVKEQLADLTNTLKQRDEVAILKEFKQIIPNQLDKELIQPIKEILDIVKRILVEPQKILDKVKEFLTFLQNVPSQIAKVMKSVVQGLKSILEKAVGGLITKVQDFKFDFIQTIYDKIKTTIESLRPSSILNGFFDSSDFQNNPQAFIQVLQARNEEASKAVWDSLTDTTKKLLNTYSGNGVPKELLNDLNQLLKSNFYQKSFVAKAELSQEANDLMAKKDSLQTQEVIRLNRLVLETLFSSEISKSLQSVFSYLKDKLAKLYPQNLIDELDKTHAKLIETLQGIPQAIGGALDSKYEELAKLYQTTIQDTIRKIFRELLKKLYSLQGELDLGLDDLGDAFNNLIAAVPV